MSNLQVTSQMNNFEQWLKDGSFARHETFCPRYGWLKKGFDGVFEDHKIFDREDAIERLGVGKNMVRAIRFWCMAFHVIEPAGGSSAKLSGPMKVTDFGKALFADDGWDPFLEDPASLWLLHWQLFMPPIYATAWSLAINLGLMTPYTLKDLTQLIIDRKDRFLGSNRYSFSSIAKDASCFIRMYAPPGRQISAEIECPFTHLGLLISSDEKQTFRFNVNDKPSLPDAILLAACLDYARHTQLSLRTLSFNRIMYHFNSPGVVFKLSETEVGQRLERAVADCNGIDFVESFGNRQLTFKRNPDMLYNKILSHYYEWKGRLGL